MRFLKASKSAGWLRIMLTLGCAVVGLTLYSPLVNAGGTRIVPMDKFSIVNDIDQPVSLTFYPDSRTDTLDEAETQDWDCGVTKSVALNNEPARFAVSCGAGYAVRVEGSSLVLMVLTGRRK